MYFYRTAVKTIVKQKQLNNNAWNFSGKVEANLLNRISGHKKLIDHFGKCYYGIKTGLNEAFIIVSDEENVEILKPIIEGKELKKWISPHPVKKLISFKCKSTKALYGNLSEEDAFVKISNQYPDLFNQLSRFKVQAKERYDKGDYWWELRNCAYYELFGKSKIIFPNLQNTNKFSFDDSGVYLNAPAVFLPTDEKYLLALLNSKVVWHFLKSICVIRSGGYIEVKPQYFEQIPIPETSEYDKLNLKTKANEISIACMQNDQHKIEKLENEIDHLVYKLYDLTEDEIKIVEMG